MRFTLIDRITDLEPGRRLTAVKGLTLAEEYLQDHFPLFPVMPGVLMLEALYQAGAWLVRSSEDFAHSIVQLSEAHNVKYRDFVEPGQSLVVTTELYKQDSRRTWLKAEGTVREQPAVIAKLVLERFNLADRSPGGHETDAYVVHHLREQFKRLYPPAQSSQR
jgi:3-hydroxyacyl-[acyl-carrier-protein] dehydratase